MFLYVPVKISYLPTAFVTAKTVLIYNRRRHYAVATATTDETSNAILGENNMPLGQVLLRIAQ